MNAPALLRIEVAAFRALRVRLEARVSAYEPASSLNLPVRTVRIGLPIQICRQEDPPSRLSANRERGGPSRSCPARPSPTFFFSERQS
jgi:hypothetical protein